VAELLRIGGLTYLADQHVIGLEVATKHFGRFTGNRIDLDANLLTLTRRFDLFVIRFDGGHDTNVHKLQSHKEEKEMVSEIVKVFLLADGAYV